MGGPDRSLRRNTDPAILRNFVMASGLKFKQNALSYIFSCPLCSSKDKLYIRKADGRFVCWKCKETDHYFGDADRALADLLSVPRPQVEAELFGTATPQATLETLDLALVDPYGQPAEVLDGLDELPPAVDWPIDFYPFLHPFAARGRAYLAGRGVPAEIAAEYGVRYAPEMRQVIFPVTLAGRLYGWQGRLVVPHEWIGADGELCSVPKSPSSRGLPRERLLMFTERLDGSPHAVIAEGPISALKAHKCGGNVATMGKGVSRYQIARLRQYPLRRVYLALDPDAAEDTARLVADMSRDVEVYLMEMPTERDRKIDVGDLTFDEAYDVFMRAERVYSSRLFLYLKL